jgi:hypothetical protein
MRRDQCAGCGIDCPEARSTDTLAQEGWRLTTSQDGAGKTIVNWFCADCWQKRTGSEPIKGPGKRL